MGAAPRSRGARGPALLPRDTVTSPVAAPRAPPGLSGGPSSRLTRAVASVPSARGTCGLHPPPPALAESKPRAEAGPGSDLQDGFTPRGPAGCAPSACSPLGGGIAQVMGGPRLLGAVSACGARWESTQLRKETMCSGNFQKPSRISPAFLLAAPRPASRGAGHPLCLGKVATRTPPRGPPSLAPATSGPLLPPPHPLLPGATPTGGLRGRSRGRGASLD